MNTTPHKVFNDILQTRDKICPDVDPDIIRRLELAAVVHGKYTIDQYMSVNRPGLDSDGDFVPVGENGMSIQTTPEGGYEITVPDGTEVTVLSITPIQEIDNGEFYFSTSNPKDDPLQGTLRLMGLVLLELMIAT